MRVAQRHAASVRAPPTCAEPRRPALRAAARACSHAVRHAQPLLPQLAWRRRRACCAAAGGAVEPFSGAEEGGAPEGDKVWLRDLTDKVVVPEPELQESSAERGRVRSRDFSRLFALLAFVPYAAACVLLLTRVPELPDVLSVTRDQALIFFVTLLLAELGLRCQRGVRLTLAALQRTEIEYAVNLEIGTRGLDGAEPRGCADARLAAARARRYAGALAVAAPLELAGAVLAALAPHPAPGVFAMVAAQLPLRACAWVPGRGGVVRPVPRSARRGAALADACAVAGAAAAALLPGALANAGALLFALAVVWQLAYSWDQDSPEDGSDLLEPLRPLTT